MTLVPVPRWGIGAFCKLHKKEFSIITIFVTTFLSLISENP